MAARSPILDAALVGVAAIAFTAPGVFALLRGDEAAAAIAKREQRRAEPAPPLPRTLAEFEAFPASFDPWFRDAFGGREALVRANARLRFELFDAALSDRFRIGRGTWVFMDEHHALANHMGLAPLSNAELEAWRLRLELHRRWLAARGAEHVVVFVPHKSSVYPEELPRVLRSSGTTRREQILAHLAANSDVRTVDVLPALLAAKAGDGPGRHVYSPHGIHWTDVGSLAGANAILAALPDIFPNATPRPLDDGALVELPKQGDSWDERIYLDGVIVQNEALMEPRTRGAVERAKSPAGSTRKDASWSGAGAGPRLVVVHDSFGPGIARHLAEHCTQSDGRWRSFLEPRLLEELAPDVVIEVYSELALVSQRPDRLPALATAEFEEPFIASTIALQVEGRVELEPGLDDATLARTVDGRWTLGDRTGTALVRISLASDWEERLGENDLVLGVELDAPTPGLLGLYHGPEPWRLPGGRPGVVDMVPVEVKPGTQRVVAPLLPVPGARAVWFLVPPGPGVVTFGDVAVRAVENKR